MKILTSQEESSIRSLVLSMATFEKGNSNFKNLSRASKKAEKMLLSVYDIEVRIEILELFDGRISIFAEGK